MNAPVIHPVRATEMNMASANAGSNRCCGASKFFFCATSQNSAVKPSNTGISGVPTNAGTYSCGRMYRTTM